MSAQHEPRRAPTREEFDALMRAYASSACGRYDCANCSDFESAADAESNDREATLLEAEILAVFDALAAERDEWKRRAEAAQSEAVRVVQVHQHEWLMRASARETFENYVMRVMAASGADANFDDCFRNIIADYDRVLARADKAEAERDAARALVRDLRDSSPCDHFDHHGHCQTHGWMETDPPCPHGRATKLLEALGEK